MAKTMIDVMKYFEYENAATFRKEWTQLSELDKEQLKNGLDNGTMTY